MRGVSVLIAGAGLAGLTAARDLTGRGAAVTVIDARDRVGGRVLTLRQPFAHGEHAEAGADLIDESQTEICRLIADVGLRQASILPGGFMPVRQYGRRRRIGGKRAWQEIARQLRPDVRAFCISEQRWDGGVAASLAAQSVAQWLRRIRASKALRDAAVGLRGFFLADPAELSLLALVDQFADEGPPLGPCLRRVTQTNAGVTVAIESRGRVDEAGRGRPDAPRP